MSITFMKGLLWMGLGGAAIGGGILVLMYLSKETESENRQELDRWVNENLSETLSKKLNLPVLSIAKVLQQESPSDIEMVGRIQNELNSVKLIFIRLPSKSHAKVRLDISYKDGTSFSATVLKEWEKLTENIRGEFLRTGKQMIHKDWNFSWVKF